MFCFTAQPSLSDFSLNMMPTEQLLLTFSEGVLDNCNTSFAVLIDGPTLPANTNIPLTGGTCSYNSPSIMTILLMTLDSLTWSAIQSQTSIATSTNNTYLVLDSGFVNSASSNLPNNVSTVSVGTFTPNTNPPMLQGCVIDLSFRTFGLMFSEGVLLNTVIPTGITVSYLEDGTGIMRVYTLTGGTVAAFDVGTSMVGIVLSDVDFAVIMSGTTNPADYSIMLAANSAIDGNGMGNSMQTNVPVININVGSPQALEINSFVLDFTTSEIELVFSEPVQNFQFNLIYVTNQTAPFVPSNSYSLDGSSFAMVDQTTFQVRPTTSVLNAITADMFTCTDVVNCFVFWQNGSFAFLNGDMATEPTQALQAGDVVFVVDTTPPVLQTFSIDLLSGNLTLTFSEHVFADVIDITGLTLTDGTNMQERLSGSVDISNLPMSGLSTVATINMDSRSLNFAKSLSSIRLAALSNITTDESGNEIVEIATSNPLSPSLVITDTSPPMILNFAVVSGTQRLVMNFDEGVDPASFNESLLSLTLQAPSRDYSYSMFFGGSIISGPTTTLTYTFSSSQFIPPFSTQFDEAVSSGAVVLNVQPGLIADLSGNFISESSQYTYTTLPADITRPTLTSFSLDVNTGALDMTFSEAVYVSSAGGKVQFYDQGDFSSETLITYTLIENGTYTGQLQNGPSNLIMLNLSSIDLNAIKANRGLCTSLSTTFLGLFSDLARDRAGNLLQPGTNALPASRFTEDTTQPVVTSFYLDMNSGNLTILFTEPIARESLNVSSFSLTPSINSQNRASLGENSVIQFLNSDTTVEVLLDVVILNSIKTNLFLCTQTSNCFLIVPQSYVDTNGNAPPSGEVTLQAVGITLDTTSPRLISYTINLNAGILVTTFSEPVIPSTFSSASFNFTTLMSSAYVRTIPITDASTSGTQEADTVLVIQLGTTSLNQVKTIASRTSFNFGATLYSTFIADTGTPPNSIVPVFATSPLSPQDIFPDTTRPQIIRFRPQVLTPTDITFSFSEAVSTSSFQECEFTMSLTVALGTFTYSGFSGGTVASSAEDSILTYTFDFNSTISSQYNEASQTGSISLTATSSLVMDLFNNSLFEITSSNPLVFTTDSTRPVLLSYTLDLNSGLLRLLFSEAVNVNPISGLVQLQNSATSPTTSVTLTALSINETTASALKTITLSVADQLSINANPMLATTISNTYLVLQDDFVSDLSGNLISPNASALQASMLVIDTTAPTITSSVLNLDLGTLFLEFSEPVDSTSVDLSAVFISGVLRSNRYSLAGSVITNSNSFRSWTMQLAPTSLNGIKVDSQVCSTRDSCYVVLSGAAFRDISGNMIIATSAAVTSLNLDVTPPMLISYSLDLDAGNMTMTFSEPIRNDSLNTNGITLLTGASSLSLQLATVTSLDSFNTIVSLYLGSSILNQIKRLSTMGAISLSISGSAATDTTSNIVQAIPPVNSLTPFVYIPDTTPPRIVRFTPSSGGQLSFSFLFDEFVNAAPGIIGMLSFQLKGQSGQLQFTDLSSGSIAGSLDVYQLTFPPSDTSLSLSTNATFRDAYLSSYSFGTISFSVVLNFFADVSGNGYNGPFTLVFTNSSDVEGPRLSNFTLDLNTGELTLTFTEDVNILAVTGNAVFGNTPSTPTTSYAIQEESRISTPNSQPISSTAFVSLNLSDVDSIVALPLLGTSSLDTYLYLQEMFAVDASGNYLNVSGDAVQAGEVIQRVVIIQPQLESFYAFDLDNGSMVLSFNVPVDVSTLNPIEIALFSGLNVISDFIQLTGGTSIYASANQTSLRIFILPTDLLSIKQSDVLATSRSNTFVGISGSTVQDLQGAAIPGTVVPLQLREGGFVSDTTGPSLIGYSFDLNNQQVVLMFSDLVLLSSFNVGALTVQSAPSAPVEQYTLTDSVTGQPTPTMIQVNVSATDFNEISSRLNLATSMSNTFISFTSQLVSDTNGNSVVPVLSGNALTPMNFVGDTTSPAISSFTLDVNSGVLQLSFSEVLLASTISLSELVLQNGPVATASFSLANESIIQNQQLLTTTRLSIQLSDYSLNSLKILNGFTDVNSTYVLATNQFASDPSGNVFTSGLMQSTLYRPDTVRPVLLSFDINLMQDNALILYFSEPVTYSAITVTSITLQNTQRNSTITRTLSATNSIARVPSSQVSIEITLNDRSLLQDILNPAILLATSAADLYISISTSNGFSDFAMNNVVDISSGNALRVRYMCEFVLIHYYNSLVGK